jgi:hypothetical protein
MFSHWNKEEYHPSPALKAFQVFLLILIVIGIGLLITQKMWVPKVVNYFLEKEGLVVEDTSSAFENDEHATLGDHRITATEAALLGEWQSTEDPHFVRIFKENGEAHDEYREETIDRQILSWNIFTKENPDSDFKGTLEEDVTYLRMFNRTSGNLYFKLEKVTPEELGMIYLDQGKMLLFKKLQ